MSEGVGAVFALELEYGGITMTSFTAASVVGFLTCFCSSLTDATKNVAARPERAAGEHPATIEVQTVAGGPISTSATCSYDKFFGPNAEQVDWFGYAISIDNGYALIAARGDDDNGNLSGAAHILRLDGKTWVPIQQISPLDAAEADEFGSAVGLHGDRAVVGAWRDDDMGTNSGSAYVFRLDGGSWVQEAKLTASDGLAGDGFGWSAAISGDYVVVGAYARDDRGFNTGAVYIYQRTGMVWSEQVKLLPLDVGLGDEFGYSVAIDGDTLVVGTPGYDFYRPDGGVIHVFQRNGANWNFTALLRSFDGFDDDRFGQSVTVRGDRLIGGSGGDGDAGPSRGSAYVLLSTPLGWVHEAKLTPGPIAAGDRLGGVALDGTTAAIGIYNEIQAPNSLGYVRIFRRAGTTWTAGPSLNDSLAVPDDRYGNAVALSGPLIITGSYYDSFPYHAGTIYSYWLDDSDDVDMRDFLLLQVCYNTPPGLDPCCSPFDTDQDGDVDLDDYADFVPTMNGP